MDLPALADPAPTATLDERLQRELERLPGLCPGLKGVAVATADGLTLVATGALADEKASAAAAFVLTELDTLLGLLRQVRTREVLVWTDGGPWYLTRVQALPYVLALQADAQVAAAALRHAGALSAARLAAVLSQLAHP